MAFANTGTNGSLAVKLWRGERMCLIGMDVTDPEDDFVGFAIEVKSPGSADYAALKNRLNFDYNTPGGKGVDGFRNFPSTSAPFQKFRWIDFPYDPTGGDYLYRVTKMHMNAAGALRSGDQVADLRRRDKYVVRPLHAHELANRRLIKKVQFATRSSQDVGVGTRLEATH